MVVHTCVLRQTSYVTQRPAWATTKGDLVSEKKKQRRQQKQKNNKENERTEKRKKMMLGNNWTVVKWTAFSKIASCDVVSGVWHDAGLSSTTTLPIWLSGWFWLRRMHKHTHIHPPWGYWFVPEICLKMGERTLKDAGTVFQGVWSFLFFHLFTEHVWNLHYGCVDFLFGLLFFKRTVQNHQACKDTQSTM